MLLVVDFLVNNDKSKLDNDKVNADQARDPVETTCPPDDQTAESGRYLYSGASTIDLQGQGCTQLPT